VTTRSRVVHDIRLACRFETARLLFLHLTASRARDAKWVQDHGRGARRLRGTAKIMAIVISDPPPNSWNSFLIGLRAVWGSH
jgi:hypothetical protein